MKRPYRKTSIILRSVFTAVIIILAALFFVFRVNIENMIINKNDAVIARADFNMYAVDVDQGDAIFLQFSDNKNMLVDCGKKANVSKLNSFLKEKNITTINYFVYTHSDEDHIGGGASVFENYNVEILYRPKILSKTENETYGNPNGYNIKDTNAYDNAIMMAYYEENCEIKYSFEGEEIVGIDYQIKFLNPDQDNYNLNTKSNTYSAVLMVEVNGKKVLLTGDAEGDVEERLIEKYGSYLSADVLKVAHHGSKTATTSKLLNVVYPKYALISVGENQWDMPHQEVLDRLSNVTGINVYTTKEKGTIRLVIDDDGNIAVSQNGSEFKFDIPIVLSVCVVIILLIWGIKPVKSVNLKNTKKKNSKK